MAAPFLPFAENQLPQEVATIRNTPIVVEGSECLAGSFYAVRTVRLGGKTAGSCFLTRLFRALSRSTASSASRLPLISLVQHLLFVILSSPVLNCWFVVRDMRLGPPRTATAMRGHRGGSEDALSGVTYS